MTDAQIEDIQKQIDKKWSSTFKAPGDADED
jgi:hypothetical protein